MTNETKLSKNGRAFQRITAERDALAVRVAELEAALREIRDASILDANQARFTGDSDREAEYEKTTNFCARYV